MVGKASHTKNITDKYVMRLVMGETIAGLIAK
jgi:hypothetical protein